MVSNPCGTCETSCCFSTFNVSNCSETFQAYVLWVNFRMSLDTSIKNVLFILLDLGATNCGFLPQICHSFSSKVTCLSSAILFQLWLARPARVENTCYPSVTRLIKKICKKLTSSKKEQPWF